MKPDIEYHLAGQLVFPAVIDLSQNVFNTFDDKDKISNESKSFLKGVAISFSEPRSWGNMLSS